MSLDSFLTIDAGSGGVKSFLITPKGEIINRVECEWDRNNWRSETAWPIIVESTSSLIRKSDAKILGISCTSMREEFVLTDKTGKEITYNLSDESEKYGYKILNAYGKQMYSSSGHWPVPNWIAGAILPWLYSNQKKFFMKISSILMISDWINFKLTGNKATEGSGACETSLFNIQKNEWDWKIIESLSLPRSIFPTVLKNGQELGIIQKEVALQTGINEETPIIVGGADTQCGLLGMGTLSGEVCAVGGTTTPIQTVTDKPIFDPKMRTWTNNYLIEGKWILESNVGYTGRGVRWIREKLTNSNTDYKILDSKAQMVPIGSNGVLTYLGPHLFDSSPPYWPMDKLGNLPVENTIIGNHNFDASILTRAIFEANSYGVKANLDQLEKISDKNFEYLKFCGGNSKSNLWMQIQADVLEIPVHVPVVPDSSAIGASILCSVGTGYYNDIDEAVGNMVRIGKIYKPRPMYSDQYKVLYNKWLATREKIGKI